MKKIAAVLDRITVRSVLLVASVIVFLCGLVLFLSMQAQPESYIRFERITDDSLAADRDIAASVTFDRDSYLLGEHAGCRIRILYRPAAVIPDFDRFKRNLGFLPFEQLGVVEQVIDNGNGVREYRLDYDLHIIGARKPGSFPFEPAMLFYSRTGQPGSNLQSVRIQRPELRVGSLYPWNAGTIPLREIREPIFDQGSLRRMIMLGGGSILLLLAVWVLWHYGRRRAADELAGPERLWQQYHALDRTALGNRGYLFGCEKIVTGLLHQQAGMSPETFWSDSEPSDPSWRPVIEQARQILARLYQPGVTEDTDVQAMDVLLAAVLKAAVEEQRLRVEQQPSFTARLKQQPRAARFGGSLTGLALVMLLLGVRTDWWLAPEIKQYNDTVTRIRDTHDLDEALLLDLQAFAGSAKTDKIRAAALYNNGTVRAEHGFRDLKPAAQRQVLDLIFQAESAEALLETVMLAELAGSQEDAITMLVNAADNLSQAELDLQGATRLVDVENADMLRNLELVTRWRHAILTRLVQLRDMFKMKPGAENEEDVISDQGLVDIINSKLPEEYEEAEMAKDNSNYIIFERF